MAEDAARLDRLVNRIRDVVSTFPVGNALNLERLAELGASEELLTKWSLGWPINKDFDCPVDIPNHPSLKEHAKRVSEDWARLEKLGKVVFEPSGSNKPPKLHVNPCAAIVKDRPNPDPSWADDDPRRTKLRIIIDLLRSLVNEHAVSEDVDFSSIEKALNKMKQFW